MRFFKTFALMLVLTVSVSFSGLAEASELLSDAVLLMPAKLPKGLKVKFELIKRELGYRISENFKETPFYFAFEQSDRKTCPDVHTVVQNDRCLNIFKKSLAGKKGNKNKIGVVVSLKKDGDDIGFWFKIVLADKNQTAFVRYGKLSVSRTDGCFGLVFRRIVRELTVTNKAQDPDNVTVRSLPELTCRPKRKMVLTSQLIVEGRDFFKGLNKKLKRRGFIMDLSFQTPTKAAIKAAAGCKNVLTSCERDYAKQVKAEARLVFEGYANMNGAGTNIEIKKFTPDPSVSGGEKEESIKMEFKPGALQNKHCRQAAVRGAFVWILAKKPMKFIFPAVCSVSFIPPRNNILFVAGIVGAIVGTGFIVGGAVTGAMTQGVQKDFDQAFSAATTPQQMSALNTKWDEGHRLATMTNVFLPLGITLLAIGGTGVVLGVVNPFHKPPNPNAPPLPPKTKGSITVLLKAQ